MILRDTDKKPEVLMLLLLNTDLAYQEYKISVEKFTLQLENQWVKYFEA
jgi:hypothetical protein